MRLSSLGQAGSIEGIIPLPKPSSNALPLDKYRGNPPEKFAPQALFDKPNFITLRCEIHDHMNAYVVVDSPHYTKTNSKGQFILKNIPAGSYTLHAQIDRKTSWKLPIRVQTKQTTRIQFPEQ